MLWPEHWLRREKKLKALILELGPQLVIDTVKTKGTHFNYGPTTSSWHSKIESHKIKYERSG